MFTRDDLEQFKLKGISPELASWQIGQFQKGVKPISLVRPATDGDGILRITNQDYFIDTYNSTRLKITKFVPASGAASRMFKSLYEYLSISKSDLTMNQSDKEDIDAFIANITRFAFYDDLTQQLVKEGGIQKLLSEQKYDVIINSLLNSSGLAYGSLPKGLLKFHSYDKAVSRTPFEEHLMEGAIYAKTFDDSVNVHFTVSPEHMKLFKAIGERSIQLLNSLFKINIKVDFSIQKSSTDTIAVTSDNTPFYDVDNKILFRPGGHGALIENLNDIDSDIIFIKNIDNVVTQSRLETTVRYKKLLAGKLIETQQAVFSLLRKLTSNPNNQVVNNVISFLKNEFYLEGACIKTDQTIEELIERLNRPIRVCGVVQNTGEPGGGPFFVLDENGCISPQIVEASQVDSANSRQKEILHSSTHFNPVDIVCAVKDFEGKKFDLRKYVDPETCFISKKSKDGRELKALELPGLWNGAMAGWNTLFVEVPIETFNPVKTVNDLLRNNHQ
jgi:hypothetical protein